MCPARWRASMAAHARRSSTPASATIRSRSTTSPTIWRRSPPPGRRSAGRRDDMLKSDPGRPMRTILVVDDSRTNLNAIGERLTALGYLTALVDNGGEALDLITARGFDLVLLDMVMPGMNGIQVLEELRSRTETSDLPVIGVPARGDPEAAVEALAAGADDHLAKPFE